MFTGKRRFDGRSIEEIRSQHRAAKPPSLSTAVRGIDPEIERIIARCVEENPAARPASAHAIIASLPGGDPLDAAVAAGETPSPAMVAAAGQTGELRPAVAWPLVIAAVAAVVLVAVMASRSAVLGVVPLPKSPDVLDARAQEIAERLGYSDRTSAAHEWIVDNDYARYVIGHNPSPDQWRAAARTRPGLFHFIYRSSTRPMIAWKAEWLIDTNDPPFVQPGMTRIGLDPLGRLISFEAIPPQKEDAATAATADWNVLFREASLDPSLFHEVRPVWSAPTDVDEKKAWEGTLTEQPDIALHLEAGAHRGRIDWFKVFGPWDAPVPLQEPATPAFILTSTIVATLGSGLLIIPALVMAVRNFRRGRADRRGAFRLALVITAMTAVAMVIHADHAATPEEWSVMQGILAWSIWAGTFTWLVYMALEPYVRRKLPHTLIAWNRLLAGHVRDPMVGRDLLVGALAGAAVLSIAPLEVILPPWFGAPAPAPVGTYRPARERAPRGVFSDRQRAVLHDLAFEMLFTFVLFRAVFRRYWVAVALTFLVFVTVFTQSSSASGAPMPLVLAAAGLSVAVILYILLRWGLLAALAMGMVYGGLSAVPLTLDASSWYAGRSYFVLAACAALAIYGFVVSLGGKPMFGRPLFEE